MAYVQSTAGNGSAAPSDDLGGTIESIDLLAAHQSGDHILAMYVAAFNDDPSAEMPLTVFCDGHAFSGRLVAASVYFDAVADRAADETIAIPFRRLAEDHRGEAPEGMELLTTYIHLLDVNVFAGARRLVKLRAWRGRLSQVSGWSTERISAKRQ
jgi:hypothetical protein